MKLGNTEYSQTLAKQTLETMSNKIDWYNQNFLSTG